MLAHAATQQRLGQIGELADGADTFRIDDLAEVGETTGVALVVGQPLEEVLAVTLGEVGADADGIFADQVHHVFDGLDVVIDGGVDAGLEEGSEHGDADEAAVFGDEAQLGIGLVARVALETGRRAVGIADRHLRFEDDFLGSLRADVGEITHHADAVHLGDHLAPEAGPAHPSRP